MAAIPTTIRKFRETFMPDWMQKIHEKTDINWNLHGKEAYEKVQAANYAKEHPPVPEPVPEMPDPELVQKRMRRATAARQSRGRASTIFTPPGEGLGG